MWVSREEWQDMKWRLNTLESNMAQRNQYPYIHIQRYPGQIIRDPNDWYKLDLVEAVKILAGQAGVTFEFVSGVREHCIGKSKAKK